MNIYFTASISGKSKYENEYKEIINCLKQKQLNLTEYVLNTSVTQVTRQSVTDKEKVYHEIASAIKSSDLVIAEISFPSVAVGHEISLALESNKPVIALHLKNTKVGLLEGVRNEKLQIVEYKIENLHKEIDLSIERAMESADIRFNFFIPPSIVNYLDWLAKKRRIPRSVFLRNLIEREMENDGEFQKENGQAPSKE